MSQPDVVEFINNNLKTYTCFDLAKEFNITTSSMGVLLKKCFRSGFIERKKINVKFPTTYGYFAKV